MSNLGPQHINLSFGGLLQLPNGASGSLATVQDGAGNATALEVSTTAVDFPIESPTGGASGMISDLATDAGSNFVGFEQAGTGAVTRSAQAKMREWISVLDFGADPTGATDSTTAFQKAIATNLPIIVPAGNYKIDSPVATDASPAYNLYLQGESESHAGFSGSNKVVINLTGNSSYFVCMGYGSTVRNISFNGGVDVFHHTSGGIDGNTTKLIDVFAVNWTGTYFKGVSPGNGSHITWSRPVLVSNATSSIVYDSATMGAPGFDNLLLEDGWIETASQVGFKSKSGRVTIKDTRFTPYTSANSIWFDVQDAGHYTFCQCDFGSESLRLIVNWNAAGGELVFRDCGLYGVASQKAITLIKPPLLLLFDNITASSAPTTMIYVDPSMTAADRAVLSSTIIHVVNTQETVKQLFGDTNDSDNASVVAVGDVSFRKSFVTVSDLVGNAGNPWQTSQVLVNVSVANGVTDPLGGGTWDYQITGTANNAIAIIQMDNSPGVSSLPNGDLTYEALVYATGPVVVGLIFGGAYKFFTLGAGINHLCFPKHFTSSVSRSVGFQMLLGNGTVVLISQFKIFKGLYTARDFDIRNDAAPTSVTYVWEKGNRVINNNPTVGQPKAWICTAPGSPGTWVSEGNL